MAGLFLIGCADNRAESSSVVLTNSATGDTTHAAFDMLVTEAQNNDWHELDIGSLLQKTAEQFLGKPYVAGLLDASETEDLVLELTKFDCVLLVENALALSRIIQREEYDFESYANSVLEIRYRGGVRDGYCSRLHYFTDWIYDNEQKGIVEDVTQALGGDTLNAQPTFMSEHRSAYPRLADSDSLFAGIIDMETSLVGRELFYVPQDRITDIYPMLRSGDIIATTTSVEGLDVSHTGLAYENEDGSFGFLHASTANGVTIAPDLHDYVNSVSIQTGILVARPI